MGLFNQGSISFVSGAALPITDTVYTDDLVRIVRDGQEYLATVADVQAASATALPMLRFNSASNSQYLGFFL